MTNRGLGFVVVLLVTSGIAAGLVLLLTSNPLLVRAVHVSAVAALVVQLAGFGCAKYLVGQRTNLFAAWGGAMAIRLLSLVLYAVLVLKAPRLGMAIVAAPALMTFALLLVVTSVVEPLFLHTQEPPPAA